MKAALAATVLAMLSLCGWAAARVHAESRPVPPLELTFDPLARFAAERAPARAIDLAGRFGTSLELVDPRTALPSWHEHAREDAVLVHAALARCDGEVLAVSDRALQKALDWHREACRDPERAREGFTGAPWMSPSGDSYAALAIALAPPPSDAWVRDHKAFFHVRELGRLAPELLDDGDRALLAMPEAAWRRVVAGDAAFLDEAWLGWVARDEAGPRTIALYPRAEWDAWARDAGLALEPRGAGVCASSATPVLCWRSLSVVERHAFGLGLWLALSLAAIGAGVGGLALSLARARRAAARDRVLVLRTLTHELRTPATSLRLDIEPLRAAFDAVPPDCQDALLRLVDSIERLNRAIHLSARYLALFDPTGERGTIAPKRVALPSASEYMEGLREEWPEEVELCQEGDDGAIAVDPDWLAVAVRNLVHNAARHGEPPVRVSWQLRGPMFAVRVSDGGATPGLSLAAAAAPFSGEKSGGGLGLGLAIAMRIAALLGGRLRHEPEPTCFELVVTRTEGR